MLCAVAQPWVGTSEVCAGGSGEGGGGARDQQRVTAIRFYSKQDGKGRMATEAGAVYKGSGWWQTLRCRTGDELGEGTGEDGDGRDGSGRDTGLGANLAAGWPGARVAGVLEYKEQLKLTTLTTHFT